MDAERLALIVLITKGLKARGYRYLAELDDNDALVIRIYKGLDES